MRLTVALAIFFISFRSLYCQHDHGRRIYPRQYFFDIELLRATAENKNGNVMVSPASVKSTLTMLLAGARGDTAKEIEDALRVSQVNEELREQLRLYLGALNANTSTAVLENANGIFVSDKLKMNPKYESIVKADYYSEITRVDYRDPNAAAVVINTWVMGKTHGLIPFVIEPDQVTPSSDFVIANALYFKSSWLHAFDPHHTKRSCFYRNGDCKMALMMDLEVGLNYVHVEDLRAHAVELPYEGKRYSMILLVPLDKDGLQGLIRDLPFVSLSYMYNQMKPKNVIVSMPKFTVNYNEDLVVALTKLHITTLFSSKTNLTGVFEGTPPHVSSFHHKVFMSVDEVGTVAAASSTSYVVPLSFDGTVEVRADRPFLFFIRDNELGVTLFQGKIEEPSILDHVSTENASSDPSLENKKLTQSVQSINPPPKPKSKSFVENLKSIFG